MRLFALWKLQEAKISQDLKAKLHQLEFKCRIVYQKHLELQAQLTASREELKNWEKKFAMNVQTDVPLGIDIQNLNLSNQTLKNEIQKIYNGDLNDFQHLENETRNMRMSNNDLESHINKLNQYLLNCTSANKALSAEIQDKNSKIRAVQDHLRRKQSLASSTRSVPYNPIQGHTVTNEENFDDANLQLPWSQPDDLDNRGFLRDHKDSKCVVCSEELTNLEQGLIVVTPCGHRFHEICIEDWIELGTQKVCPQCRTPIDSQSLTLQTNWDNTKKLYSCFHVNLT